MWGLGKSTDVPTLPPADVLAQFNARLANGYNPITAPIAATPSVSLPQQTFLSSLQTAVIQPRQATRTEAKLAQLDTYVRDFAMSECARHGLMAWRPDFRGSPETPYNAVHRIIAETIFLSLAASHAFAHKRIDLSYIEDKPANRTLFRRTFNHFVFYTQRNNWKKELLLPGSVEKTAVDNAMFGRRLQVQELRQDQMKEKPRRQQRTAEEPAQISCDERAQVTVDYHTGTGTTAQRQMDALRVCSMPLRSGKYTRWYQYLDGEAEKTKKFTKKRPTGFAATQPKLERIRVADAPESKVSKLPSKTTIDWFEPDEFNSLPAAVRRLYADHPRVAFPLDENLMYQNPPHESMTMKEAPFMEKYGKAVLALYKIPGFNAPDAASSDPDADTSDSEVQDVPPAGGGGGGGSNTGGQEVVMAGTG
ncbi:hypothetical protein AURDEDRAFT_173709 [Auricularia subglabra TFB-10046 SS5]|uniref:Uncharacterized protein n=1 Tax=Auricularia subglabra (strain TFB-10046 / SS5) TaxID=717982 RepID=J0WVK9_AURST|nr:hypothetical protein AURDEDRAFT_173709 [Auricularia subglabra TFB-10046 SS5]